MLSDRILISTEEAKRFLRVSLSEDDQFISNLIKASLVEADSFIGDAFEPEQIERLNDHEQYADDSEIATDHTAVNGTVTLEIDAQEGENALNFKYTAVPASIQKDLIDAVDMSKVTEVGVWIKGDEDNEQHVLELELLNTAGNPVVTLTTRPQRFTTLEKYQKISFQIEKFKTLDGMGDIKSYVIRMVAGEAVVTDSVVKIDTVFFAQGLDIPEGVKDGCLEWISLHYSQRTAGINQETEGGISKIFNSDGIPKSWEQYRRIPV